MPLYGTAVTVAAVGCLLAFTSVGLLSYWAFLCSNAFNVAKPRTDYDSTPRERSVYESSVVLIRDMLAKTRDDDERMAVVDFAFEELGLPKWQVERLLDEVLPLVDPHDAAAFSARLYLKPRLRLLG